jgi:sterol desaturase/sphingolipid hydroxylase (fatty acid hydroxylase superfamily)
MRTDTFVWNYIHMLLHGYHHVCPMDAGRLTFPPLPAVMMYFAIHATLVSLLGIAHGTGCMGGVVIGYVLYDCTHFWLHHASPHTLPSFHRSLKRHHLFHHFKNPDSNFGISSYIADWIFQTFDQQDSGSGTKLTTYPKL